MVIIYWIYYGFVCLDFDVDGFFDCVDICVGDNNFDVDGDGMLDVCDMDCVVDVGLDFSVCLDVDIFVIFVVGLGEIWFVVLGNFGSVIISLVGVVIGFMV